jgi:hypothetical protein
VSAPPPSPFPLFSYTLALVQGDKAMLITQLMWGGGVDLRLIRLLCSLFKNEKRRQKQKPTRS